MSAIRLAFVGVLIACAAGATPVRAVPESSEVPDPPSVVDHPPSEFQLSEVRVELETLSIGTECPRHLIAMTGDGLGSWGCIDSTVPPLSFAVTEEEVLDFLTTAYNARFFDMPWLYGGGITLVLHDDGSVRVVGTAQTDGTVRVLTVRIGDYTKRVQAVDPYPGDLRELMDIMRGFADRVAGQLNDRPSN